MPQKYWLFKSEPDVYSIDDLQRDKITSWEGVRNYQARNFLRDEVRKGDKVLFYHSSAEPPGVAGIAEVTRDGYPDKEPTWYLTDIQYVKKLNRFLPLESLRKARGLENMLLLKKGQRLSIQPVSAKEWEIIQKLSG